MRAVKITVLLAGLCTIFVVDRLPISPSTMMESASYEWPFVWDAGTNLDPSGYDWMGAAYVGDTRGLKMPPSHDVFGELQNVGPDDQVVQYDDVIPFGALPGGPLFNVMPGDSAALRSAPAEEHKAIKHNRLMQALARSYTDYDKKGGPISCTCDSAAAGDEEMEGIYKSVKPACTCKGGLRTRTTGTEQGGPLDSGAWGAWPQDLPIEARVDGISQNAYRALPAQLWQRPGLFQSPLVYADVDNITAPCENNNPGCHHLHKVGVPISRWPWEPARRPRYMGAQTRLFESPVAGVSGGVDGAGRPCRVGNPGCHRLQDQGYPVSRWPWDPQALSSKGSGRARLQSLALTGDPVAGGEAVHVVYAAANLHEDKRNPGPEPPPGSLEAYDKAAQEAFKHPWQSVGAGPEQMAPYEAVLHMEGRDHQALDGRERMAVLHMARAFANFAAQTDECAYLGPACGEKPATADKGGDKGKKAAAAAAAAPSANKTTDKAAGGDADQAKNQAAAKKVVGQLQALAAEADHHLLLWPHQRAEHKVAICPCKVHAVRHLCYQLFDIRDACDWSNAHNKVCDNEAYKAAQGLCKPSAGIATKLPGVNIDQNPWDDYLGGADAFLGPDWPGEEGSLGATDSFLVAGGGSPIYPVEGVHQ